MPTLVKLGFANSNDAQYQAILINIVTI